MKISKKEGIGKVKITHNKILFWIIIILIIGLIGLIIYIKSLQYEKLTGNENSQLANPASVYCLNNSGKLEIRTDASGGQYGVCIIYDEECEEWAYFRGECNFSYNSRECSSDNDCVASSCCHASSCVNIGNKPDCIGIRCTQECKENTLDCNLASCKCVNKKCSVVLK